MGLFNFSNKKKPSKAQDKNYAPLSEVIELKKKGLTNNQIIERLQKEGFTMNYIAEALNQAEIKNAIEQPTTLNTNLNSNNQVQQNIQSQPENPITYNQPNTNQNINNINTNTTFQDPFQNQQFNQINNQTTSINPLNQQNTINNEINQQNLAFNQIPQNEFEFKQNNEIQMKKSDNLDIDNSNNNLDSIEEVAEAIIDEKWNEFLEEVKKILQWKDYTEDRISKLEQKVNDLSKNFETLHKALLERMEHYDKNVKEINTDLKALHKTFKEILPEFTTNINVLSEITKNIKNKEQDPNQF